MPVERRSWTGERVILELSETVTSTLKQQQVVTLTHVVESGTSEDRQRRAF